jgi:hypothetical protein
MRKGLRPIRKKKFIKENPARRYQRSGGWVKASKRRDRAAAALSNALASG